jgi:cytidylate kinase
MQHCAAQAQVSIVNQPPSTLRFSYTSSHMFYRVFKYQVLQHTYPKDHVTALTKIRTELLQQVHSAESDLSRASSEIHCYERVGTEFAPIIDEYAQIQERITHVQWALSQL